MNLTYHTADALAKVRTRTHDLRDVAQVIGYACLIHFPDIDPGYRQALCQIEEVGEFVGAYRRWSKMARRPGSPPEMENELSDIVITTYVTGHVLRVSLPALTEISARPARMERLIGRLVSNTARFYAQWSAGFYDQEYHEATYTNLHAVLENCVSIAEVLCISLPKCTAQKLENILTRGWRNYGS